MKQNVFRTSSGINIRNFVIPIMISIILLFIFLAQLPKKPEDTSPGFTFFMFMAFNVFAIGLGLIFIFPNTKTIEFNVDQKKLKVFLSSKKTEIIELENVKKIILIRRFLNSFFSEITYYQLNYLNCDGNLAKLYFKIADKESRKFLIELKNNRNQIHEK